MERVKEHYERLLARNYTWMFGKPFDEKVAEQKTILQDALAVSGLNVRNGLAIDLGCGPGYQSIAMAQMGFCPVIAIDSSASLLVELRSHTQDLPIQAVENDILHLEQLVSPRSGQVIVCMGDTITHLEDRAAVLNLFRAISTTLAAGGVFVLTYRDLSDPLYETDRFIPVQSDDHRIMTCFLEFDQPETVMVHDLVHTRGAAGWQFEKSCYRKLRLPLDWLERALLDSGFTVTRGQAGRLLRLISIKQ